MRQPLSFAGFLYDLLASFIVAAFVIATATIIITITLVCIGVKFIYGELHFAENRAGIVIAARFAVLFRQTEVGCRKHKLYTSFHTDNREYADGNVYVVGTHIVHKGTVEARTNGFGDCIDAHAAVTEFTATLYYLAVEADRACNLNHNGGKSGFAVAAKVSFIEAEAVIFGIGSKYRYILFTAIEYNFLIKRRKAFYFLNSAAADTGFERYTEVVTNCNLIKAFVEGNRFDIDVCIYNLYAFASYGTCLVDDLLSHIAKMNTNIFETIFITGRIEYFIYADAAELILLSAESAQGAVSFNHYFSSFRV